MTASIITPIPKIFVADIRDANTAKIEKRYGDLRALSSKFLKNAADYPVMVSPLMQTLEWLSMDPGSVRFVSDSLKQIAAGNFTPEIRAEATNWRYRLAVSGAAGALIGAEIILERLARLSPADRPAAVLIFKDIIALTDNVPSNVSHLPLVPLLISTRVDSQHVNRRLHKDGVKALETVLEKQSPTDRARSLLSLLGIDAYADLMLIRRAGSIAEQAGEILARSIMEKMVKYIPADHPGAESARNWLDEHTLPKPQNILTPESQDQTAPITHHQLQQHLPGRRIWKTIGKQSVRYPLNICYLGQDVPPHPPHPHRLPQLPRIAAGGWLPADRAGRPEWRRQDQSFRSRHIARPRAGLAQCEALGNGCRRGFGTLGGGGQPCHAGRHAAARHRSPIPAIRWIRARWIEESCASMGRIVPRRRWPEIGSILWLTTGARPAVYRARQLAPPLPRPAGLWLRSQPRRARDPLRAGGARAAEAAGGRRRCRVAGRGGNDYRRNRHGRHRLPPRDGGGSWTARWAVAGSGPFPHPALQLRGDLETWLAAGSALAAEDRYRQDLAANRRLDAATGRVALGAHRS